MVDRAVVAAARVLLVLLVLAGAACARPTPSAPWGAGTTPPVTLETVTLFLRLTPIVRGIEEQTYTTLEEVHRAHLYARKRQLEFRMQVLEEQLEDATGVSIFDYMALKSRILDIHKTLFAIRKLQEERVHLLQVWRIQLEHDTAPDELFVARRMHIDDHIADLLRIYEEFPAEGRAAVEARFKRILSVFEPPKRLSRAELRERRERAAELLPQPPENPYRESFFDEY